MDENTRKAYTEVLELLSFLSSKQIKEIPEEKIKHFFKYRDENYNYVIDSSKSFYEQNMLPETKAILAILFEDYLATDEQKQMIKQRELEYLNLIEEEKRKQYNTENLFKRKT